MMSSSFFCNYLLIILSECLQVPTIKIILWIICSLCCLMSALLFHHLSLPLAAFLVHLYWYWHSKMEQLLAKLMKQILCFFFCLGCNLSKITISMQIPNHSFTWHSNALKFLNSMYTTTQWTLQIVVSTLQVKQFFLYISWGKCFHEYLHLNFERYFQVSLLSLSSPGTIALTAAIASSIACSLQSFLI